MKWKITNPKLCLYLVSFGVLFTGLMSSISIYLAAKITPNIFSGFEFEKAKNCARNLAPYGGKINVLSVEFMNCFIGLWHGKTLAYTVTFITIFISAGLAFAACHKSSDMESECQNEHKQNGHN
jgi:hypothetical protein